MTVKELLMRALSVMGEEEGATQEYSPRAVDIVNLLLAENLGIENALREKKGLEPFETAPVLRDITEELPFGEQVSGLVLVYGLATALLMQEDDAAKASFCENRYMQNRNALTVCVVKEIGGGL